MIDKLLKGLQDAAETIRQQASQVSEGTKEKAYQVIDDWLQIFPRLETYGLEVTSFGLSLSLTPGLDVELVGKHDDFSAERLEELLAENKGNTAMTMVLNTIKTTYALHRRSLATLRDPLVLKIRVRLSPEVKVILGRPELEM